MDHGKNDHDRNYAIECFWGDGASQALEQAEEQDNRDMAQRLANSEEEVEEELFAAMEAERKWSNYWQTKLGWDQRDLDILKEYDVLRASAVRSWRHDAKLHARWPRWQDIQNDDENSFMKPHDKMLILLFISHRWESEGHPDSNGHQLLAVQNFLDSMHRLAVASQSDDEVRLQLIPSLEDRESYLLAASIFGNLAIRTGGNIDHKTESIPAQEFADDLLLRTGLFYDFACLPQASRNQDDDDLFRRRLARLQGLYLSFIIVQII